jgi:hypothetical protein
MIPMNTITLKSDDGITITFTGSHLASECEPTADSYGVNCELIYLNLYRTDTGVFICEEIEDVVDRYDGSMRQKAVLGICRSELEVARFFGTKSVAISLYNKANIDCPRFFLV